MVRSGVLISLGTLAGCLAASSMGASVQVAAAQGAAKPVPVTKKTYTDPEGGVSFQYPALWTFSRDGSTYFTLIIVSAGEPVQAALSFSPKGNYYEHTTLTGLEFLYRRKPTPTRQACEAVLLDNSGDGDPPAPLTIHGVAYAHLHTGDAEMMKSVEQDGYVTWRGGTCYLFEGDLREISLGVDGEKNRALTNRETQALKRHLSDIMQSVQFTPPAKGQ